MKSDKANIADARSMIAALSSHLTRLSSLDGARNPSASFDECDEAMEVADQLRCTLLHLRTRYLKRDEKKLVAA